MIAPLEEEPESGASRAMVVARRAIAGVLFTEPAAPAANTLSRLRWMSPPLAPVLWLCFAYLLAVVGSFAAGWWRLLDY